MRESVCACARSLKGRTGCFMSRGNGFQAESATGAINLCPIITHLIALEQITLVLRYRCHGAAAAWTQCCLLDTGLPEASLNLFRSSQAPDAGGTFCSIMSLLLRRLLGVFSLPVWLPSSLSLIHTLIHKYDYGLSTSYRPLSPWTLLPLVDMAVISQDCQPEVITGAWGAQTMTQTNKECFNLHRDGYFLVGGGREEGVRF